MRQHPFAVGEPVPWFTARSPSNPRSVFDNSAGRYVVLCFFGSAADEAGRQVMADAAACSKLFDGAAAAFFGVSIDPDDERLNRVQEVLPGVRVYWDTDQAVSGQYGAIQPAVPGQPGTPYRRFSLLLDERLRVLATVPFGDRPDGHVARLVELLVGQPPLPPAGPAAVQAPVLVVPRVFEPDLCRALIRYYDERGGKDSGFMREIDGRTVPVYDYGFKRRRDQTLEDEGLRRACMVRIHNRLVPEIHKAYQFHATRIERYIVACYEAETGGHFKPHRDNTTTGTAHRRFAVSMNLNTGEFDGGDLRFPEFGRQTYRPPAGGAVVFSCSLLHEATPVTRGRRYAFLPFLYDDAAAKIRERNLHLIGPDKADQPGGEQQPA